MDELAHAVSMDPLEFRLKNLTDPRLRAVFQAAADKFGWGRAKSTPERGFGIAGGTDKGGYVATCAEVEIDPADKKSPHPPRRSGLGVRRDRQSRRTAQPDREARSFKALAARCSRRFNSQTAVS